MEDLKVGDLIKCMSFYGTGVTVGKVYQIDNLDDNKKRITFVDDDLDTRSIGIKNFNTYFKKVDNQLEKNQKQRPSGENMKPTQYKDGIDTFDRALANMTKVEILACCKFNIDKYNWRKKNQDREDFEKIIAYAHFAIDVLDNEEIK